MDFRLFAAITLSQERLRDIVTEMQEAFVRTDCQWANSQDLGDLKHQMEENVGRVLESQIASANPPADQLKANGDESMKKPLQAQELVCLPVVTTSM